MSELAAMSDPDVCLRLRLLAFEGLMSALCSRSHSPCSDETCLAQRRCSDAGPRRSAVDDTDEQAIAGRLPSVVTTGVPENCATSLHAPDDPGPAEMPISWRHHFRLLGLLGDAPALTEPAVPDVGDSERPDGFGLSEAARRGDFGFRNCRNFGSGSSGMGPARGRQWLLPPHGEIGRAHV